MEKTALESTAVDGSWGNLTMHSKADDAKSQSLLESDLFNPGFHVAGRLYAGHLVP